MANQTRYTDELGAQICEMICNTSLSLRNICKQLNVGHSTVREWIANKDHPMSDLYARAKKVQIELLAEEILDIADDGSNDLMTMGFGDKEYETENKEVTNRSKLRVDARKWLLSKLDPKKYGDKLDVTSDGEKINQVFKIGDQTIQL